MLIIDMNQVMIANLMAQIKNHTNAKIEENMLRHMIFNSLRSYVFQFKNDYGKIVIACDGRNCWRKSIFPYYKASRKKKNESSEIDWKHVYQIMNSVASEIEQNFPYKVLKIDEAEADDVIATIIKNNPDEHILILSGDKDFIQLHKHNVKQFDPIRKKWITHVNPPLFLKEHIIRGDFGDGVPNVLSSDNCLVLGERQKTITKKRMGDILTQQFSEYDTQLQRNFMRNKTLIDLQSIPDYVSEKIINEYNKEYVKDKSKILNFFISKKLKNLIEHISDF